MILCKSAVVAFLMPPKSIRASYFFLPIRTKKIADFFSPFYLVYLFSIYLDIPRKIVDFNSFLS